jgi:hypothetical protein
MTAHDKQKGGLNEMRPLARLGRSLALPELRKAIQLSQPFSLGRTIAS